MVAMTPGIALLLIPLLPLAAGLIALLFLRKSPMAAAGTGIGSLLGSVVFAVQLLPVVLKGDPVHWEVPWVSLPGYQGQTVSFPAINIPLALDLGLAQLLFVLTAALLAAGVMVYALREREADPRAAVFHANITLFAASMLVLLCADTLLLVYLAWELLGLFSLILIAHPGTKEARRAARQAFWTTRATDMGLLFAVFTMMAKFNWMTLSGINAAAVLNLGSAALPHALQSVTWICLLVLLAVLGKSAQWPLSFWLADAMVAPAPVSALLHAATLVAAGPYLLVRLASAQLITLSQTALVVCTILGGVTLVLGGVMAFYAREPKRVLAYSTISQLGMCICGIGLLAENAAYYHLLAHAWCKAALFIGVGILVSKRHAGSGGTQPRLQELAGTARRQPLLLCALVLAGASLAGVPFLGGAHGKEELIWAATAQRHIVNAKQGIDVALSKALPLAAKGWPIAALLLIISVVLTAAYFTRLIGLLGWGLPSLEPSSVSNELDADQAPTASEPLPQAESAASAGWMGGQIVALLLALIGSLGWGLLFWWFKDVIDRHQPVWKWMPEGSMWSIAGLSLALLTTGAGGAWFATVRPRQLRAGDAQASPAQLPFAEFFAHGMYLREFWHSVVARTGEFWAVLAGQTERGAFERLTLGTGRFGRALGVAAAWIDQHIVDGVRWQACEFWWHIRRLHSRTMQNGDLQHYMFVILIGAVILCIVVIRPLSHIFGTILQHL